MTPAQYEQRCAEMLRRNARNMSPSEIERFAYGAGDKALQTLAAHAIVGDKDKRAQYSLALTTGRATVGA